MISFSNWGVITKTIIVILKKTRRWIIHVAGHGFCEILISVVYDQGPHVSIDIVIWHTLLRAEHQCWNITQKYLIQNEKSFNIIS